MKGYILAAYEHSRLMCNRGSRLYNARTNQVGIFRHVLSPLADSTIVVDVKGAGIRQWSETEIFEILEERDIELNQRIDI